MKNTTENFHRKVYQILPPVPDRAKTEAETMRPRQ